MAGVSKEKNGGMGKGTAFSAFPVGKNLSVKEIKEILDGMPASKSNPMEYQAIKDLIEAGVEPSSITKKIAREWVVNEHVLNGNAGYYKIQSQMSGEMPAVKAEVVNIHQGVEDAMSSFEIMKELTKAGE